MHLLLDTHALLWFALDAPQLSSTAKKLIEDVSNEKFVSPASYWEIAIKISTGKYSLNEPFETFMNRVIAQHQFPILEVKVAHAALVSAMPFHHKDPFDRLIAAQALVEQVPLVSGDTIFDAYGVTRLW